MSRIVLVLVLVGTSGAFAQSLCVPDCRDGFMCVDGACVSACNPTCAEGEECVGQGVCQPFAPIEHVESTQPVQPQPEPEPVRYGPPMEPISERLERRRAVRARVRIALHIGWSYQLLRVHGVTQTTYDPGSDWMIQSSNIPGHVSATVPSVGLQVRGGVGLHFGWNVRAYALFAIAPNIRLGYRCEDTWCGDSSVDYDTRVFAGLGVDGTLRVIFGRFFIGGGVFGGYVNLLGDGSDASRPDVNRAEALVAGLGEVGWFSSRAETLEIAIRGGGGKGVQGQIQLAVTIAFN